MVSVALLATICANEGFRVSALSRDVREEDTNHSKDEICLQDCNKMGFRHAWTSIVCRFSLDEGRLAKCEKHGPI